MPKFPRLVSIKKLKLVYDARVIIVFNIRSTDIVQFEEIIKVENRS